MTQKRALLSGYYGFGNAGDEAILEAAVESLKKWNLAPTVLSANPEETSGKLEVTACDRKNWKKTVQAIRESDLVLSGGGGLFQDVTSFRSLIYYLRIPVTAKFLGKKTMIFGQGIGPIRSLPGKIAMRLAGNLFFDRITVRDEASQTLLRSLGVKKKMEVTADLAFLFPLPSNKEKEEMRRRLGLDLPRKPFQAVGDSPQPIIGINLRRWKNLGWHLERIAKGITLFCESRNVFPVLLPFQANEDNPMLEWLHRILKIPHRFVSEPLSPKELLAAIANFDFVVGMRYHALLFAALSLVPFVGIAYDAKVESLGESLGLAVLPLGELSSDRFPELIDREWKRRAERRNRLASTVPLLREKSEQNIKTALELLENPG